MKLKIKGFTLIELLVVIAVIAIVIVVAIPISLSFIDDSKRKASVSLRDSIMKSAKLYITEFDNETYYQHNEDNEIACVRIKNIKNAGYINKKLIDPLTNNDYSSYVVKIVKDNNNVINSFEIVNDDIRCYDEDGVVLDVTPYINFENPKTYEVLVDLFDDSNVKAYLGGNDLSNQIIKEELNGKTLPEAGSPFTMVGQYQVRYILNYLINGYSDTIISDPVLINVVDTKKPVITLVGEPVLTIKLGSTYIEQGINIKDNYYDDMNAVTSNVDNDQYIVNIASNVNTNVMGVYTINYNVIDGSGNNQSITRTVNVLPMEITQYAYSTVSHSSSSRLSSLCLVGYDGSTPVYGNGTETSSCYTWSNYSEWSSTVYTPTYSRKVKKRVCELDMNNNVILSTCVETDMNSGINQQQSGCTTSTSGCM